MPALSPLMATNGGCSVTRLLDVPHGASPQNSAHRPDEESLARARHLGRAGKGGLNRSCAGLFDWNSYRYFRMICLADLPQGEQDPLDVHQP